MIKDASAAIRLIHAATWLRGSKTRINAGRIEALGAARMAWFVGVQLIRIAVALSLGLGGIRLLCKVKR